MIKKNRSEELIDKLFDLLELLERTGKDIREILKRTFLELKDPEDLISKMVAQIARAAQDNKNINIYNFSRISWPTLKKILAKERGLRPSSYEKFVEELIFWIKTTELGQQQGLQASMVGPAEDQKVSYAPDLENLVKAALGTEKTLLAHPLGGEGLASSPAQPDQAPQTPERGSARLEL